MTTAMFVVLAITTSVVSVVPSAFAAQPGCSGNPHDDDSGNPHDFQSGPNGNPHSGSFHSCPGQGTDQN
jgi:hypothetical protein